MTQGQVRRYVGRETKVQNGEISHRAKSEPTEIDTESVLWKRIVVDREMSALVPADEESARVMGLPFIKGSVVDGEWSPEKPSDEHSEARAARNARREKLVAARTKKPEPKQKGGDK